MINLTKLSSSGSDGGGSAPAQFQNNSWLPGPGSGIASPSPITATHGPVMPEISTMAVQGSLGPDQPAMNLQFALESTTQSMAFSLRALPGSQPGTLPVVQKLILLDQDGATVAETGADWGPGQVAPQDVTVAMQGAPAGGRLVVQIAAVTNPSGTTTGAPLGLGQSATWSVPFLLDVQRQDQPSATVPSGAGAAGQGLVGTLALSLPGESGSGTLSSSAATSSGHTAGESSASGQTVASAATAPSEPEIALADGFNLRVPIGPLASRSAGPLGPILATAYSDPTPQVDRNERALYQEIEGDRAIESAMPAVPRSVLVKTELSASLEALWLSSESNSQSGSGPVVSVPGAGGFPLKVTGPGGGSRADLAELLETLPPPSGSTEIAQTTGRPDELTEEDRLVPLLNSPLATEVAECPDLVKAAWVLAVGVGFTSGPLFPDLASLIRMRVPGWLRIRPWIPRFVGLPVATKRRFPTIREWLRGLRGR
jgi:hypothetical protein